MAGLPEPKQFIVDIAHNLFTYNSTCKATPYEISRLGDDAIGQVFTAIRISSGQLKLELGEESGVPVIRLGASVHEQKKEVGQSFADFLKAEFSPKEQEDVGKDLLSEVSHLGKGNAPPKVAKEPLGW